MEEVFMVNPRKKRRKARRKNPGFDEIAAAMNPRRRRRRRRNPDGVNPKRRARRRSRRRYSNPRGGGVMAAFMPAVQGAIGAIGIDLVTGFLPLPATMKTGPMRNLVRAGIAIGGGMLLQNMARGPLGRNVMQGALTVVMHDAARDLLRATGMPLGDEDLYGIGEYVAAPGELPYSGMSEYVHSPFSEVPSREMEEMTTVY